MIIFSRYVALRCRLLIDSYVPLLIGRCHRFYFLFTPHANDVTVAQDGSAHFLDALVFRLTQWEEATMRHPSLFYVHVTTYTRARLQPR